ncbi:EBDP4, emopamil-binding protein [Patellaria atrata CBS 101060]|uniref:EBDP4, emopamil-binding protein n=1 Tax=Patellaria atrata CBS 101060 TaxID=1346257 RepID=A0A9P4SKX3_9PEZI|nr:EBDP4, emopamil-binding protein [Patellaria atrata CBS 101060]
MKVIPDGVGIPTPPHPYYPLEIQIAGYLANEWGVPTLLFLFASGCTAIFSVAYIVATRIRPQISTPDLITIMWFVLSGSIHLFFEGFYVYNYKDMGSLQNLFGQLWKEYALSDSRYLTQDPFVLCMETITAVTWGPLSFAVAAMIIKASPYRYPFQAIVSLGQIYGDVLYYGTATFDHWFYQKTYCRPESYYYWVYFILMNAFWIVIPGILLTNSVTATARAFRGLSRMERTLNSNGSAKKSL